MSSQSWSGLERRRADTVTERVATVEARLDGHEDLCAERFKEVRDRLDTVDSRIGKIEGYFLGIGGAIILLLIGILTRGMFK